MFEKKIDCIKYIYNYCFFLNTKATKKLYKLVLSVAFFV